MSTKEKLSSLIIDALNTAINDEKLIKGEIPQIVLEVPPRKELGDFASNIAMQSAKVFRKSPREIAEIIIEYMDKNMLARTEIAGPGFINFFLKEDIIYEDLRNIIEEKENYGRFPKKDHPYIQVEYVSANPTGLLHVGHGRGAAYGSALVNLLKAAGYNVESEYYINDAGNQIDMLAESVNARYLELLSVDCTFPENGYRGQDIIETAENIINKYGDAFLELENKDRIAKFKEIALSEKLNQLKIDLKNFNVEFDNWFSEQTLHPDKVNAVCEKLQKDGKIYEKDGALWLKSTEYGDDKDRVVIRENGVPTYLAADIAYHNDKYQRNFDKMINIWGADHHGYIPRVKAAMSALGYDASKLDILLLQMVSLYRNGELVKMSKRTGKSVTLQELIEEVGTDAARYFFVMRSLDSQLDFDLDLAKSQSSDNPVYYIQYAHARISSIFRQAKEIGMDTNENVDLSILKDSIEVDLIKKLIAYKEEIKDAARLMAPHRIANYIYDLASMFHSFYNKCRILGVDGPVGSARLMLIMATGNVIKNGLNILGVSAPEKM